MEYSRSPELHSIVMSCSSKKENGRQKVHLLLTCVLRNRHTYTEGEGHGQVFLFLRWMGETKYLSDDISLFCAQPQVQPIKPAKNDWDFPDMKTSRWDGPIWRGYMEWLHVFSQNVTFHFTQPIFKGKMCYVKHNSFIINTHNYVHVYVCTINKMWSCCFAI